MILRPLIALLAICSSAFAQPWDAAPPPPWRRSDTTLIQLCFDGLDSSVQKRLQLRTISESSMGAGFGADLVGLTLTERPIYQGTIDHPMKYKSTLVRLPNSEIWLRIDKPNELEKNIDVWRDAAVTMCTSDPQADFKILRGASASIEAVPCPDIGIHVSLKVASYSEHALSLAHLRSNGTKTFNNLRGCREFVHVPSK